MPTNCCSTWFCPANKEGQGMTNLAVFFYGCGFDCLFCQNFSHKEIERAPKMSEENLIEMALLPSCYCLCFFGGSCEPQLPFTLRVAREIFKRKKMRICIEWNGIGNPILVKEITKIVFESGGNVKFDLKTYSEDLSYALSGVSNKKAYENFEMIAREFLPRSERAKRVLLRGFPKRKEPVLTATTLLVPGYVDKIEVENIAKFIASLNPEIPYSLLVFFPAFYMKDLPITPKDQVKECYQVAKKYLKNVNIGNKHLLEYGK